MRKLFVWFIIILGMGLFAAINDSLNFQLDQAEPSDKLQMLIKITGNLTESDPDQALIYAEQALPLAIDLNDKSAQAQIYKLTADIYFYLYKLDSSLKYYLITADMNKELYGSESAVYCSSLADVAFVQESLLQHDSAIETNLKALAIARKLNIWEDIIIILNNIGNNYYKISKYEKSLQYLQETLKAEEQHGSIENQSSVLNSIAMVYEAWGETEKAADFYQQALEIDRKFNNTEKIAIRLNNLGYLYQKTDQPDRAMHYLLEALEIERTIGNPHRLAIRLSNISSLYISLGKFETALQYLEELENYLDKYDDIKIRAAFYENYGNYYFNQQKNDTAIDYYQKALKLAEVYKLDTTRQSTYADLAVVYKEIKDYKSALFYRNRYIGMQDSIFNEEKHKQFAELEMKYETEKKEKEIELLKKNAELQEIELKVNRRTRNFIILILFLIILLVIISFISYRHKQKFEQVLQAKKAMEQSRLAILGELIAGIIHEINQPMQSISFSLENIASALNEGYADSDYLKTKIGYMTEDVQRMNRIISHIKTFAHQQVGDKQEAFDLNESIYNALRMTEERLHKHNVRLEIDLKKDLPKLNGNLYNFEQVILILLSNAADAVQQMSDKSDKTYQKKVCVRSQLRDHDIIVQVGDNGIGIDENIIKQVMQPFFTTKEAGKGTGLGLSIARGIINDMNGSIIINSVPDKGTIINLSFSLEVIDGFKCSDP